MPQPPALPVLLLLKRTHFVCPASSPCAIEASSGAGLLCKHLMQCLHTPWVFIFGPNPSLLRGRKCSSLSPVCCTAKSPSSDVCTMTGKRDHREVQLKDSWRVGGRRLPEALSLSRFEVAALRPRNDHRVSSGKLTSGKRVRP